MPGKQWGSTKVLPTSTDKSVPLKVRIQALVQMMRVTICADPAMTYKVQSPNRALAPNRSQKSTGLNPFIKYLFSVTDRQLTSALCFRLTNGSYHRESESHKAISTDSK